MTHKTIPAILDTLDKNPKLELLSCLIFTFCLLGSLSWLALLFMEVL